MAPDNTSLAQPRMYAWLALTLAGLLLGFAIAYIGLGENVVVSEPSSSLALPPSQQLRVIPTQALYIAEFKAPEILPAVWQDMQKIIEAENPFQQTEAAIAEPSLLRQFLQQMAPVQTVLASPPRFAPNGPKQKQGAQVKPALQTVAESNAAQAGQAPAAHGPEKSSGEQPDAFGSGTLGQLTKLRAELEQLKLQVSIEETRSRLNQLRGNSSPEPKRGMPSLEYPPIGMPTDAPAPSAKKQIRILSIQSVNGKYAATVSTASGPRVVRVNDSVGDGRVVSITRNSVVINRGQGNETLSIQD